MVGAFAASLLVVSQVQSAAPTPIEIPCHIELGKCSISLPVGGKDYWFLIDTGNEKSWISPRVAKELLSSNTSMALTIGSLSLSAAELTKLSKFSENSVEGDDGVLGMDVLSKIMFGIDYEHEKFLVWPPNTVSITVVQAWIAGPNIVPVQTQGSFYDDDNRFYVSSSYGWLCLDTGSPLALLPKVPEQQADFHATNVKGSLRLFTSMLPGAELVVAPILHVAPVSISNVPVMLTSQLKADDGGVMGTWSYGPKVLFDGPGKTFSVGYDASGQYEFAWTMNLLTVGISQMHDGKPCIDLSQAKFSIPKPKDTWARIVSINGVQMDDLQTSFANHEPSLAKQVRDLLAAVCKGCKGQVMVDGKLMPLNLDGK